VHQLQQVLDALTADTLPSSGRPPWFEKMMPSTSAAAASRAASASNMPLMIMGANPGESCGSAVRSFEPCSTSAAAQRHVGKELAKRAS